MPYWPHFVDTAGAATFSHSARFHNEHQIKSASGMKGFMFGKNDVEIQSLKLRISALEETAARQQQLIDQLLQATELQPSIPRSLMPRTSALHPEVLALLNDGKEIAAIKRHREITGAGLKEAKDAIDREKSQRGR